MQGIYWGLTALALMGRIDALPREEMLDWVMSCWDADAGAGRYEVHAPLSQRGHHDACARCRHLIVRPAQTFAQVPSARIPATTLTSTPHSAPSRSWRRTTRSIDSTASATPSSAVRPALPLSLRTPTDAPCRRTDIVSLQDADTGSFAGDEWGEVDTRFSYCAVSALSLLGRLDAIDRARAAGWIARCRNFDGGFGTTEGAESHAAYGACVRYCSVAS